MSSYKRSIENQMSLKLWVQQLINEIDINSNAAFCKDRIFF